MLKYHHNHISPPAFSTELSSVSCHFLLVFEQTKPFCDPYSLDISKGVLCNAYRYSSLTKISSTSSVDFCINSQSSAFRPSNSLNTTLNYGTSPKQKLPTKFPPLSNSRYHSHIGSNTSSLLSPLGRWNCAAW